MALDTKSYWEERLSGEYSLLGVGDIGLGHAYNYWLYRVRSSIFNRLVRTHWSGELPERILDVGSGTGFYIDLWLQFGVKEVMGADLTAVAVKNLSERFPSAAGFEQLDISAPLPKSIEKASFDAISVFDVLFHIVEDAKFESALQNLGSLLKPGGLMLYSDNFPDTTQEIGHQSSRSWQLVEPMLKKSGLKVRKRCPMFVLMNDPVRTKSRVFRKYFSVLTRFIRKGERFGGLAGRLLYGPELLATSLIKAGPSTEILVLEKVEPQ